MPFMTPMIKQSKVNLQFDYGVVDIVDRPYAPTYCQVALLLLSSPWQADMWQGTASVETMALDEAF